MPAQAGRLAKDSVACSESSNSAVETLDEVERFHVERTNGIFTEICGGCGLRLQFRVHGFCLTVRTLQAFTPLLLCGKASKPHLMT